MSLTWQATEKSRINFLGMSPLLGKIAQWMGRDADVPYVVGLEKDGQPLLTPYCPPYYPSMEAAVRAVVEAKFGPQGTYRDGSRHSAWADPASISQAATPPSDATVEATIAYCDYIYRRYGRFPAYSPPLRTVLGFQATHLDVEFYDCFYRLEALTDAHRQHVRTHHSTEGSVQALGEL